jgi:TonB family protein
MKEHVYSGSRQENRLQPRKLVGALMALTAVVLWAQVPTRNPIDQAPDQFGVYYAGPEVAAPRLLHTALAGYPTGVLRKDVQGMTVMAMVIGADGVPAHIQVLRSHGDLFDQSALAAVQRSTFGPGKLAGKPVPVWIDVRVVFRANHSEAIPEVLITERDLPAPDAAQFEDRHNHPLLSTEPYSIHTVDADFANPFVLHPFVQVAVVTVLIGADGLPKTVQIRRGLGFGLDQKAVAAVEHYRFVPATKNGRPIAVTRDISVNFAKF